MARKPVTWYIATPADGIIEMSREAGTPVNLAANVGKVIDHPNPCRNKWFDESRFSYFRMVKRVGEALEDTGIWPITWPVRLWIVEPLGETGNWSQRYYPYRLLSHQIRVLEETDAHRALGPAGRDVLNVIQQEIPERAARWAADWDADPKGMRDRKWNWEQCGGPTCGSGRWADSLAMAVSHNRRESAAQTWIEHLARNAVDQALADTDASMMARCYAYGRATGCAVAAQHQARFEPYVLDALRGVGLDSPAQAVAA
ncbi:hypothetical protein JHN55_11930 [Streptomyces sp. MBT56]|uniref:hypothetical protein n=1 Tax=unclassified Streptomyces TaxID=2593676 RepID=UPI00190CAC24|nr:MULTISPECIES: hypothetical protein [unclassified Streptomyces]MBK3557226.1 hypothetical protein [Streptomyces sp. MBT56]MBK3601852.1 hypothetical protein [Streptomyces sp. MBT54]MBK3618182.1 hypothetical protein [Streptomyces sp. MBT98]MBK3625825.1 hypothetical protein [Streptomyces sp. MBT49]